MKIDLPNHHAIFIEGTIPETIGLLREKYGEGGDPDVIWNDVLSLGIEEARELIKSSQNAPLKAEKKKIIISFGDITREAQNALLKLFEDPNPRTEFIIASENAAALLPTLRSRLHIIRNESEIEKDVNVKKFLSMTLGDKLAFVEKLTKEQKDTGSKSLVRKFLQSLIIVLEKDPKKNTPGLRAVASALLYIDDKGSSVKLVLENVALSL